MNADWFSGAEFSEDKKYRYRLWRRWNAEFPTVYWIMLNPSKADELKDDPTIRRCRGFSINWGFGGLEVVNLFAFRSTYPYSLVTSPDPVGPRNDEVLRAIAPQSGDLIMAAWGAFPEKLGIRDKAVCEILAGRTVKCLGMTLKGYPKHPLYIAGSTRPEEFPLLEEALKVIQK